MAKARSKTDFEYYTGYRMVNLALDRFWKPGLGPNDCCQSQDSATGCFRLAESIFLPCLLFPSKL
jgi:hypothetical protein